MSYRVRDEHGNVKTMRRQYGSILHNKPAVDIEVDSSAFNSVRDRLREQGKVLSKRTIPISRREIGKRYGDWFTRIKQML